MFETEFLNLDWWVWLILICIPLIIGRIAIWESNRDK